MNRITMVLADRHRILRQGVQSLLERERDFSVVAETGNGLEAVDLVERLQPHILLLGLSLPGLHGLEVMRLVRPRSPRTRFLVLSMYSEAEYVRQALQHGASGYVLKDAHRETLAHAIRIVAAGGRYLCPPIAEWALEPQFLYTGEEPKDPYDLLSIRERQVLQLTAEDHTSTEIAGLLSISPRTVEVHRSNAMHKLGLRTRLELIRYALRHGILPPDLDT